MCRYNIAIDDALMEEVRPSIGDGVDEVVWVQLQVEALFRRLAAEVSEETCDVITTASGYRYCSRRF